MRNEQKLTFTAQPGAWRNPRSWVPALLGVLALANLGAAWFVWQTPGGSSDALASQVTATSSQVARVQAEITRLRALVKKVETARNEQNQFVTRYFLDKRTASSAILSELGTAAFKSGLAPREHTFNFEPVEGSDVFSLMTITAAYEGRYSDLRQFIASLDRSERFLIIEDVTAAPQQEAGKLAARFRINAFVRETGAYAPLPEQAPTAVPQPPAATSGAPPAPLAKTPRGEMARLSEEAR